MTWNSALVPANADGEAWELFHENSKTNRFDAPLDPAAVRLRMDELWPALNYDGFPRVPLPPAGELSMPLSAAILGRHTARAMQPGRFSLDQVASLLHHAYGQTRDLTAQGFARQFRVVPSGGALYPLEIYFHSSHVDGLAAGWYHYSPVQQSLHLIRPGDDSRRLSDALVQRQMALDAGLLVCITALFPRSTFKYRERGYRFVLLEAGHVAQNLCLAAQAMNLGVAPIGGYLDREIDALLSLDGIVHSTVYMLALGTDSEITASLPAAIDV